MVWQIYKKMYLLKIEEASSPIALGLFHPIELRTTPSKYYRYEGSFSVPPCTEHVFYLVLAKVSHKTFNTWIHTSFYYYIYQMLCNEVWYRITKVDHLLYNTMLCSVGTVESHTHAHNTVLYGRGFVSSNYSIERKRYYLIMVFMW